MVAFGVHEDMQRLVDNGVVVVMHGADTDTIIDVADALHKGGVTTHEITADSPDAMDLIRKMSASFSDNEAIVGAGTALDAPTANTAIQADMEFVVGPNFDGGVVGTCNRYGMLVVPGIMTPTEATDAYSTGTDLVKVFPASSLGPGHLKSMKESLPQIPMMLTGDIGLDNAADHIETGVVIVGVGGALMDDEAIGNGDSETITETAREFSNTVDDAWDDWDRRGWVARNRDESNR